MRLLNGIFPASWRLSGKASALLIACTLIIGSTTGGTMAWLIGNSSPVHNMFTPSKIGVSVEETPTEDGDDDPNTNAYQMTPGATIFKDPIVTVEAGSENLWLLVKMEKSENFDDFMTFGMEEGWTALEGVADVYWRMVDKANEPQTFETIKDSVVMVRNNVTAAMLNTLTAETYPSLCVTAYAVQHEGVETAEAAYALVLGEEEVVEETMTEEAPNAPEEAAGEMN